MRKTVTDQNQEPGVIEYKFYPVPNSHHPQKRPTQFMPSRQVFNIPTESNPPRASHRNRELRDSLECGDEAGRVPGEVHSGLMRVVHRRRRGLSSSSSAPRPAPAAQPQPHRTRARRGSHERGLGARRRRRELGTEADGFEWGWVLLAIERGLGARRGGLGELVGLEFEQARAWIQPT